MLNESDGEISECGPQDEADIIEEFKQMVEENKTETDSQFLAR